MKKLVYLWRYLLPILGLFISTCSSPNANNENWTLIDITEKEISSAITKSVVTVKNCCGLPEIKTKTCSAGTSSDMSFDFGVDIGLPGVVSISPSIGQTLGFNKSSEESIELPSPPDGYIYQYEVITTYSIITGNALYRSENGTVKKGTFNYHASCSITANPSPHKSECSDTCDSNPNVSTEINQASSHSSESDEITTPTFTSVPKPQTSNFIACSQKCNIFNHTRIFPEGTTIVFLEWDYENIPLGADYSRTWTMNGIQWVRYQCDWNGNISGHEDIDLREPGGLHSGIWRVQISVDNRIIMDESFEVLGNETFWDPVGEINSCHDTD
jgi:hypothetical protein